MGSTYTKSNLERVAANSTHLYADERNKLLGLLK